MNPVKAKIVKKESDYEYSSYNNYLNKTGFIHEKILKFIFDSSDNYIEKFHSIKYKNLASEKEDLKEAFDNFLIKENINLQQILKDRNYIKKFICYLISNNYEVSKKELAQLFGISKSTLYRKLNKSNDKNRQKDEP